MKRLLKAETKWISFHRDQEIVVSAEFLNSIENITNCDKNNIYMQVYTRISGA